MTRRKTRRRNSAATKEKVRKSSAKRRVAVALAKFLKQANPGRKYAGCKMQRNAGGSITIIPIKVKRSKQ
jgi:hypothetical protein